MLNSYGYNRKTLEQDKAILSAVKAHHEKVRTELKKHEINNLVMTVLIGSQNYDLDDKQSDIDTFTFFFPKIDDLMTAADVNSFEFEMPDGKCYVKDVRTALNLLKKTSPNSVEYLTSKYKYYDSNFEDILKHYINNNDYLYPMVHCNYKHMLMAIAGMAHQLSKRNMPAGKSYAHALRLVDMKYHFLESINAESVLELRAGGSIELLTQIKRDTNKENEIVYTEQTDEIAHQLQQFAEEYELSDKEKEIEITGKLLIYSIQEDLFKRYIALNKNILMENEN